nr:hypothetical protein [Nostoc sp. CreGUA01]
MSVWEDGEQIFSPSSPSSPSSPRPRIPASPRPRIPASPRPRVPASPRPRVTPLVAYSKFGCCLVKFASVTNYWTIDTGLLTFDEQ